MVDRCPSFVHCLFILSFRQLLREKEGPGRYALCGRTFLYQKQFAIDPLYVPTKMALVSVCINAARNFRTREPLLAQSWWGIAGAYVDVCLHTVCGAVFVVDLRGCSAVGIGVVGKSWGDREYKEME